ncbi:hypothetical protein HY486_01845 [Candidatus Woesearchaeota archaeon]|nr:hypothetical protein [Candidatus Woesearchaeota archaeon]
MGRLVLVKKRDGSIVPYQQEKIIASIQSVLPAESKKVINAVITDIEKTFSGIVPTTKQLRDVIEKQLSKYKKAVQAYSEYKRSKKTEFVTYAGIRNDLNLPGNTIDILSAGILMRNEHARIIETPSRMFRRVAKALAMAEKNYHTSTIRAEEEFYQTMTKMEFLPSVQILSNAARTNALSQCIAFSAEDSLAGIMRTAQQLVMCNKQGIFTGINFSKIRPKGNIVRNAENKATGPLSFAQMYDAITKIVFGKHINDATIALSHPDSALFSNTTFDCFTNWTFVDDAFLEAIEKETNYSIINPHDNKTSQVNAKELFANILTKTKNISFVNKTICNNQPLDDYQCLFSGSINLPVFVKNDKPEWHRLRKAVREGVRMLDNAIDINAYILPESEQITKQSRTISISVNGFAEMLSLLNIPYTSPKALKFAEELMLFIKTEARKMSDELAKERTKYPSQKTGKPTRNEKLLSIMETGASLLTNTSPGIEPFQYSVKIITNENSFLEINPTLERMLREHNCYDISNLAQYAKKPFKPPKKILFSTFADNEFSIKLQAVFEKYIDGGVAKNIPASKLSPKDLQKLILSAKKMKLKTLRLS